MLYVFLHGLAVGQVRNDNWVEIALPFVSGHVCRAGSWLEETDIARNRTLTLVNVNRGSADLAAAANVLQLTGCHLTGRGRAATLLLPQPGDILELLIMEERVDINNKLLGADFAVGSPRSGEVRRVASILVFVYEFDDENQIFLDGHDWQPCSTGGAISLHIISTSIAPEGKDHEADTQNALAQVITNYPGLTFRKPPIRRAPNWNETGSDLYGLAGHHLQAVGENILTNTGDFVFAQAELEMIPTRTVRIGRLGRMKQQGRDLANLWHEPDPLFETPCDCGFCHLRRF